MGVALGLCKAVIAAAFLLAALVSYSMGAQRNDLERNEKEKVYAIDFLPSDNLRRSLVSQLRDGSSPLDERLLERFARLKPTSEVPFEVALSIAARRGDEKRSNALAAEALKRQPRSLAARLYHFRKSADERDLSALLEQYVRLMEMGSLDDMLLTDALMGVFRETGDWNKLLKYLESQPSVGLILVDRVLKEPSMPSSYASLLSIYPSRHGAILKRVRQEKGLAAAYKLWRSYTTASSSLNASEFPFNGEFKHGPERSLFNWTVHFGRAEKQQGDGLFVSYAGTGTPLIVRQIMSAPPGDYVLESIASGRMYKRGGMLQWVIFCSENGQPLKVLDIALTSISTDELFRSELSVPEIGCEFQTIELRGKAGQFPKISRIKIHSISLIGSD